MTRLLVSTVRRNSPTTVASGYVYVIELEPSRVIQRSSIVEPAYKQNETNPRGGMRGAKGIAVRQDEVILANSSSLFRFNPQWDCLGVITHPSCAFIHDIQFQGDSVWVAAASSDLLIQFSLTGQILRFEYMREPSLALEQLKWNPPLLIDERGILEGTIDFRDPASHEHIVYDNAHVNSLGFLGNGDILVSMGLVIGMEFAALKQVKMWMMRNGIWPLVLAVNKRIGKVFGIKQKNLDNTLVAKPVKARSAVVRITPDGKRFLSLSLPNMTTPCHSLLVLPDETVIYLNTSESKILRFEPQTGEILSNTQVAEGFLRGAAQISERNIAVGSKDQLFTFDWVNKSVVDSISITDDPTESIYDVKVLPPNFHLPPLSFAEHLSEKLGINSPEDVLSIRGQHA